MFFKKEVPQTDNSPLNFCCQVKEVGCWGGDPDSDYQRHITFEEAVDVIKYLQSREYNKFLVSTTIETQREARKALKACGFETVKSFPGSNYYKVFFHYWRNPKF